MSDYLPLFRPGSTVTFNAAAAITGGQLVELGAAAGQVVPAAAGSAKLIGVAGHDAAVGDPLTVEVNRPIHELVAASAIALGARVEAAAGGKVATLSTGEAFGLAITAAAADGDLVQVIQL